MSINIPAETADESTNPISVEEFERLHPAMLGAIRKAVREEPARTVIGAIGDDRRSHLSSLDLRGIGIEVRRQLSARDMTTEVMGSILEHINQAADRLSAEIQELRSELIREHVETVIALSEATGEAPSTFLPPQFKEQNQALADALENATANNANSKEEN